MYGYCERTRNPIGTRNEKILEIVIARRRHVGNRDIESTRRVRCALRHMIQEDDEIRPQISVRFPSELEFPESTRTLKKKDLVIGAAETASLD